MDEEMKKRIRESAEGLELPKSLCPEQMEVLLSEKTRKKPVPIFRFAAVAAAVLAVFLVPVVYMRTSPKGQEEETISLMGAPMEEGTGPAAGLNTFSATSESDLRTVENMEELQAMVDEACKNMQTKNAETQEAKRAAGLMAAGVEAANRNELKAEKREGYGSAGPIGLLGDILWFYQEGNGLIAVKNDEGRLLQTGKIPDGGEGSVTAFCAAEDSLFVARQRGDELLTQIYSRQAGTDQWEEAWRAVSAGEFESVDYDGTYFNVTMRCYPKAGEEESAFLPIAGGRQLKYEEIYLQEAEVGKNQYLAAFSVDSKAAEQIAAAAIFGGGENEELVFSGGSVWARASRNLDDGIGETGRFTAQETQLDGQPALQVTLTDQEPQEAEKQSAVLTIPEFTPGHGQIVPYENEYAVVPAVSAEGKSIYLVISWDEDMGLALERVMETEGEVQAILCSEDYLYLLTDEKLLCYNRRACGPAGSLDTFF